MARMTARRRKRLQALLTIPEEIRVDIRARRRLQEKRVVGAWGDLLWPVAFLAVTIFGTVVVFQKENVQFTSPVWMWVAIGLYVVLIAAVSFFALRLRRLYRVMGELDRELDELIDRLVQHDQEEGAGG